MTSPPQPTAPVLSLSDNRRLIETDDFAHLKLFMDEMTTGKKPSTIRLFRVFIEKKTMSLIVNPYDMYGFTVEFKIRENNEFHVVYVTDRRTEKLDQTRYEATVKNGDVIVEYHHTMKWFLNKIPEAIENFHVLIKGSVSEEIRVALYPKMAESFGGDGAKLPRVKKFTMDYSGKVNDEQDVLGFLPYVEMVEEKQLVFRQEDDFGGRNELRLQEVFKTPQWKAARELTLENKFWCNFHNECWWQFERAVLDCKTLRRIDVQAFIEHIFRTNRLPIDYTIDEFDPIRGAGDDIETYYAHDFKRDFSRGFGQMWFIASAPEQGAKPMDVGIHNNTFYIRRS